MLNITTLKSWNFHNTIILELLVPFSIAAQLHKQFNKWIVLSFYALESVSSYFK